MYIYTQFYVIYITNTFKSNNIHRPDDVWEMTKFVHMFWYCSKMLYCHLQLNTYTMN